MQIDVKKVFLYNDDSFEANGIDDKKYELIKYHSYKEREIWRINSINLHTIATVENSVATLYKKTLELLIDYDNLKGKKITPDFGTAVNLSRRNTFTFETPLQKQIFINNFIFLHNDNLIKFLSVCNIKTDNIEELISLIKLKQKRAKLDNNYILEINNDLFNIEELCKIYKCKYPTLIINKLLELYYKNPELFNNLEKKR